MLAFVVPRASGDTAVRLAEAVTLPALASIFVWPDVRLVAIPLEETAATSGAEELQYELSVKSCVTPLAYVPVATNCWLLPGTTETVDGAIAKEISWSCTVRVVEAASAAKLAEILVSPVPVLTAVPGGKLLIAATVGTDELQFTLPDTSTEVPSL